MSCPCPCAGAPCSPWHFWSPLQILPGWSAPFRQASRTEARSAVWSHPCACAWSAIHVPERAPRLERTHSGHRAKCNDAPSGKWEQASPGLCGLVAPVPSGLGPRAMPREHGGHLNSKIPATAYSTPLQSCSSIYRRMDPSQRILVLSCPADPGSFRDPPPMTIHLCFGLGAASDCRDQPQMGGSTLPSSILADHS